MFLNKLIFSFSLCFCFSSEAKLINISDINDYWNNNISYTEELNEDIWQVPETTFKKRTGDCEDFAIAKYYHLLNLGYTDKELFLYWVLLEDNFSNKKTKRSHVVLVYKQNEKHWVLDNYSKDIVDLKNRTDITKVFGKFNHEVFITTRKNTANVEKWKKVDKHYYKNISFFNDFVL